MSGVLELGFVVGGSERSVVLDGGKMPVGTSRGSSGGLEELVLERTEKWSVISVPVGGNEHITFAYAQQTV